MPLPDSITPAPVFPEITFPAPAVVPPIVSLAAPFSTTTPLLLWVNVSPEIVSLLEKRPRPAPADAPWSVSPEIELPLLSAPVAGTGGARSSTSPEGGEKVSATVAPAPFNTTGYVICGSADARLIVFPCPEGSWTWIVFGRRCPGGLLGLPLFELRIAWRSVPAPRRRCSRP